MGARFRICVLVCFVAGSCGAVMGQAKPSVVFEIDASKLGHVWVHYCVGISSANFSSDSRLLAAACGNKVRVWSVPEGEEVAELPHDDAEPLSVIFSPVDDTLACRDKDGVVWIWCRYREGWELSDKIGRDILGEKEGHGGYGLAFSPDGRFLAWNEIHTNRRRILRVWDVIEHQIAASNALDEYLKRLDSVKYVGFTDDGEWLKTIAERRVSRGYVHEVRTWSVGEFLPGREPLRVKVDSRKYRMASQGGKLRGTAQTLSSDGLMRAHMSPDGEFLELMDMTTRKSIVYPRFLPAPPGLVDFPMAPLGSKALGMPSIRFSHDKRLLAVATFHTRYLLLWGVNTGREYARLDQPAGVMWPVAFSPNDRYLFAISGLMTPVDTEMLGTVWDLGRENPTPSKLDYRR